jgi:hypothetical protein
VLVHSFDPRVTTIANVVAAGSAAGDGIGGGVGVALVGAVVVDAAGRVDLVLATIGVVDAAPGLGVSGGGVAGDPGATDEARRPADGVDPVALGRGVALTELPVIRTPTNDTGTPEPSTKIPPPPWEAATVAMTRLPLTLPPSRLNAANSASPPPVPVAPLVRLRVLSSRRVSTACTGWVDNSPPPLLLPPQVTVLALTTAAVRCNRSPVAELSLAAAIPPPEAAPVVGAVAVLWSTLPPVIPVTEMPVVGATEARNTPAPEGQRSRVGLVVADLVVAQVGGGIEQGDRPAAGLLVGGRTGGVGVPIGTEVAGGHAHRIRCPSGIQRPA